MYLPSIFLFVAFSTPLVDAITIPDIPMNGMQLVLGRPAIFSPSQVLVAAHQYFNPNAFDFWEEARKLGHNLKRYTDEELQKAGAVSASVAEKIGEFKATVEHLVAGTKEFADKLRQEGIDDLEQLSEKLAVELGAVLEELKAEFSQPLPEDETPRQAHRAKMISSALSKVEDAIVRVTALWGVSEEKSRAHFNEIKPHVKNILFVCGQVIDDHPKLVEILLFTGAALIIPEAWFLRPILSLFGFGPNGPVKGSTAAWGQRAFWGAAVAKNSWFSRLQSAGMRIKLPGVCKTVGASVGAGVAVSAGILGSCGC